MSNSANVEYDTSGCVFITMSYGCDPVLGDALSRAGRIVYDKQREWSGWFGIVDRHKLRNLIADEIADAVRAATKGAEP